MCQMIRAEQKTLAKLSQDIANHESHHVSSLILSSKSQMPRHRVEGDPVGLLLDLIRLN